MRALKLAVVVLSLGLDTFAVSVGLGLRGWARDSRRVAVTFALFEGGMPALGFFVGKATQSWLSGAATYAGMALLFAIGSWMLWEAVSGDRQQDEPTQSEGQSPVLVILGTALSVSLDELVIGFSLGLLGVPIVTAIILIAAQAFCLTLLGMSLGRVVGRRVAERSEILAGAALIGLSLVLLLEEAKH